MPDKPVTVNLPADEAIVLFELLSRNAQKSELQIEGEAERIVLADLLWFLERELAAPFDPNYREILAEARRRLGRPR